MSTNFSPHFQKRAIDDQLDVIRLLHEGLIGDSNRCVVVYEGREINIGEMRARVAHVLSQLRRAGLKPKDRVAVMLSNSVDHIALIYGLILFGAVWIPVNVRLRGAGLSYIVEHACPKLMIFDAEFQDAVAELSGVPVIRVEEFCASPSPSDAAELVYNREITHKDPLCIIYTSGTTGAPKGVVFTHRMLRIAGEAALKVAAVQSGDRLFMWEPLCHIGGAQMLMTPFLVDAQLHVVKRFSSSQFWKRWQSAKATHLHYLGGVLDILMQLPDSETPPAPSIRVAWGAGVSATAWALIQERFGCEIRECYGMTECSSFATLNTTGTPGSIGAPLPWIRVELLDDSGRPVTRGDVGEMVLSSDVEGVFLPEYLDNPEATRKAMRGGQLHTGDLARQLENGEYVFVGRRTDSMRVRGENVSAWEVERVFVEHPAIKAAAAVSVPGAIGEHDILLYVQFEEAATVVWADLIAWARPRLANFQLPRYFATIDKFELTPSERIRKHLLPRNLAEAWDRTIDIFPHPLKESSLVQGQ